MADSEWSSSDPTAGQIVPWHPDSWAQPASYAAAPESGRADVVDGPPLRPSRQLRYRYDRGTYTYDRSEPDWLRHELTTRSTEIAYKGASVRRDRRFVDTKAYASPEAKERAGNAILASEVVRHWLVTLVGAACVAAFLLVLLWAATS
jgi:hypothetical protein